MRSEHRLRPLVAGLLALTLTGSTGILPAYAEDTTGPAPLPEEVTAQGVLSFVRVTPDVESGEEIDPDSLTQAWLTTAEGTVLPLAPEDVVEHSTGDELRVTLEVSEEITAAARTITPEELPHAGDEAGTDQSPVPSATEPSTAEDTLALVSAASSEVGQPLTVLDSEVTAVHEDATGPQEAPQMMPRALADTSAHTVDVVYLTGAKAGPARREIDALISSLSSYYRAETNNRISSVAVRSYRTVAMPTKSLYCGTDSAANGRRWDWAAKLIGHSSLTYQQERTHLLVIQAADACPSTSVLGLADWWSNDGTVSSPVDNGGRMWLLDRGHLQYNRVLLHEFGHNVTLGHSGELACDTDVALYDTAAFSAPPAGSDRSVPTNPQCRHEPYGDRIDTMGNPTNPFNASGHPISTPAALNSLHRLRLGSLPLTAVRRVTSAGGAVQDLTIAPSTYDDPSTTRLLSVQNPKTGKDYVVEYRAGVGRDARALYNIPSAAAPLNQAPGVRVLREVGHFNDTVALQRHTLPSESGATRSWMPAGSSLTTFDNGFTVQVLETDVDHATVRISFRTPQVAIKQVTLSGTPKAGATLTATPVAPNPANAALTYQWLRNGRPISGASRKTYVLTSHDVGTTISVRVTGRAGTFTPVTVTSKGLLVPKPVAPPKPPPPPKPPKPPVVPPKPPKPPVAPPKPPVAPPKPPVVPPKPPVAPVVERLEGKSRVETAVAVASRFPASREALLTTGLNFPDAVTATSLSRLRVAPVYLTVSRGTVEPSVLASMKARKVTHVTLIGGVGALPNSIVTSLRKEGISVDRIAGNDRFETATRVAQTIMRQPGSRIDKVFVVDGMNFPDALAAGAVSGRAKSVIVLSAGKTLPASTRAFLSNQAHGKTVAVAGGSAAKALQSASVKPRESYVGATRYETATLLARAHVTSPAYVVLANGNTFPDALAGGALAATKNGVLVLTDSHSLPATTQAFLAKAPRRVHLTVIGGSQAVSQAVLNKARSASQ